MFIQSLLLIQNVCIEKKKKQLTGNVHNDSEVTIKVKEDTRSHYAKYVFF